MNKKGKFIVIEGTDGSGKHTQTNLLADRLKKEGYEVEIIAFPQFGERSATLVEDYLNGKYGPAKEVSPFKASIFYACDRFDASFRMKKWLEQGKIVISDRYVGSNMAHQGGKIKDKEERKKYLDWVYDLEYNLFAIPKPDINIILHVDAEISQKMIDHKKHDGKNDYVASQGKKDIHENIEHLKDTEEAYLEIAKNFSEFELIECVKNGQLMDREEIHEKLYQKIKKIL